jgi:hypothetical protein
MSQLFNNVTVILKVLFEKEEAQLIKREHTLITKNAELSGPSDGFRHMGVIYSLLTGTARRMGSYGRLDRSLLPEMDTLLADRLIIETDRDRVRQALAMVLKDCRSSQDMRDALPNAVKDLIPECRNLERIREEAFTLADNPRSYTRYMKLREKIEFYVASRLLY